MQTLYYGQVRWMHYVQGEGEEDYCCFVIKDLEIKRSPPLMYRAHTETLTYFDEQQLIQLNCSLLRGQKWLRN